MRMVSDNSAHIIVSMYLLRSGSIHIIYLSLRI